jgi:protein-S-isoprenylcysteine O-methyltransferase Ste14
MSSGQVGTRFPGKPPVYFVAAILMMRALHRWFPLAECSSDWAETAGTVVLVSGIAVAVWGVITFWRQGTTVRPSGNASRLVTTGPYGFTRNPMYLGLALALAGIALRLGSVSPWMTVPLFVWVITRGFIRAEERMLAAKFPDAYGEYRRRVRRWI